MDGTDSLAGPGEDESASPIDAARADAATPWRSGGRTDSIAPRRWWLAVSAVMVSQLLLRWWSVLGVGSYHDDIAVTYRALSRLDWSFLNASYAGHWGPLGRLVEWLTVNASPFNTGVAFGVVLALMLVGDLGMALALRRLVGRRLTALLVFACWAFTPVIVTTISSWSLGLNLMAVVAAMAWATLCHLRANQVPSRPAFAAAGAMLAVALLLSPQSLLVVPFLVLLSAAYPGLGTPNVGILAALRRVRALWVAYGGITIGYLWAYRSAAPSRVTDPMSAGKIVSVLRETMLGVLVPGFLGGSWGSDPGALPSARALPVLAVTSVLQVLLVVIAVSCLIRVGAWRAWAALATLVLAHTVVLAAALQSDELAGLLRQTRYLVPLLVPAYVLTAAAFSLGPERAWYRVFVDRPHARTLLAVTGVAATMLFLQSAWVTTYRVTTAVKVASTAEFWKNVRTDLAANPGVSIVDRTMPSDVLYAGFLPELGSASESLAYFVTDQVWNAPSEHLYLLADDGHLQPARVEPFGRSLPGPAPGCGYLVTDQDWVRVPIDQASFNWGWGVRLNYVAAEPATLQVRDSGATTQLAISKGPGNVTWVNPGVVDEVSVRLAPGSDGPVCVDYITVGGLVPS